ncbi:MAG: S8 family serine peptidase [Clostridiales bacterium]|nr:S8 family serine peptidase [Clostridiales bacterium]
MFQKFRSPLALLLVCALLLTCFPAPALAAELEDTQTVAAETASDDTTDSAEEETETADEGDVSDQAEPEAAEDEDASTQEEPEAAAEETVSDQAEEETASGEDETDTPSDTGEETPEEEPDAAAETTWVRASDPTEIAQLIRDNWSDDYFQEAVVDTRRNRVTVDGESADLDQVFEDVTEADEDELYSSTAAVEAYFADTAYETETQSSGKVSVTAPYQSCRVVLYANALTEDYGAETILEYSAYDEYVLQFATAEDTQAAYEQIVARYGEEACYVDQIVTADDLFLSDSTDTSTIYSWGTTYMGLDTLKSTVSTVNDAVTVAIVDSGIDADHAFFEGRTISADSYNFLAETDEETTDLSDPYGHGTHVAGIIAEGTPDNVELLVLRVLDESGNATLLLVNTAMQYALDCGADVINLSLGLANTATTTYTYLDSTIQAAYDAGIPVCCAAGNGRTNVSNIYPACNSLTIAVSAIKSSGAFASSYSNYGTGIDFCAPGSSIVSALTGGGTTSKSGTSMAAAAMTAAMTYAVTVCPDATVDELYSVLQSCVTDLGDTGKDKYYGWGCVTDLADLFTDLSDYTVTLSQTPCYHRGAAQEPAVTVKNADGGTLTQGTDYTVSYSNNTTVGTATVTVTGKGSYTGTVETTFTIVETDLSNCTVTLSQTTCYYSGTAQKPAVTVKNADGNTLTQGTDYTVSYSNNTAVGTATVTITGKGAYTGTATATFTIKALATPTLSSVSNTTSGVKVKWKAVTGAAQYRVCRKASGESKWTRIAVTTSTSYTDTTAVSGTTYKYTVRCLSADGSTYTSSYNSTGLSIKYLTAGKISSLTNTSKGITVKWSKVKGASGYYVYRKTSGGSYKKIATVKSGSTVSYSDTAVKSKNGTTYVYAVRPYYGSTLGSYTGKTTVRLTGVCISSLKNVKTKKMTVKWGKNSKATGYQIQYSTSSSFSSYKTVTVTSCKTVSKTISSLTKGKRYYVRVRAYKTVSGTKYYSAWSSKKNVKISK